MFSDFVNFTDFTPAAHQTAALEPLFDQVVAWSNALATVRASSSLAA